MSAQFKRERLHQTVSNLDQEVIKTQGFHALILWVEFVLSCLLQIFIGVMDNKVVTFFLGGKKSGANIFLSLKVSGDEKKMPFSCVEFYLKQQRGS